MLACLMLGIAITLGTGARAAGDAAEQAWPWQLTGIVLTPALREALFTTGGQTRVVVEGEQIDGWTLSAVAAGTVTLRKNATVKRLGPDAWIPDEIRAADSLRRAADARAAQAAAGALANQQQDQATAESALGVATEQMMRQKPR